MDADDAEFYVRDYSKGGFWADGPVWLVPVDDDSEDGHLLRSEDAGATWTLVPTGLEDEFSLLDGVQLTDGGKLLVGAGEAAAGFSRDGGKTWTGCEGEANFRGIAVAPDGRIAAVGPNCCLVVTDPRELIWEENHEDWFEDVCFDGQRFIAVSLEGNLYASTGGPWESVAEAICECPRAVAARGAVIVVGGEGDIATSEDGGQTFDHFTDGVQDLHAAAASSSAFYVCGDAGLLFVRRGGEWSRRSLGGTDLFSTLYANDEGLVAASGSTLSVSTDAGKVCQPYAFELDAEPSPPVDADAPFAFSMADVPRSAEVMSGGPGPDGSILLGGESGLLLRSEEDRNWTELQVPVDYSTVWDVASTTTELVASLSTDGLKTSSDGGETWETHEFNVCAMAVSGDAIFVVTITTKDDDDYDETYRLQRRAGPRADWSDCGEIESCNQLWTDPQGNVWTCSSRLACYSPEGQRLLECSVGGNSLGGLPGLLLALDGTTIHVSEDGGNTWSTREDVLPEYGGAIWCGAPDAIYVGGTEGQCWFSTDGGRTFVAIPKPAGSSAVNKIWGPAADDPWVFCDGPLRRVKAEEFVPPLTVPVTLQSEETE